MAETPAPPGYTVLAADDDRANLLVIYRILSPEYTLLTAKTGGETLSRALSASPDIILLDVVLPDISGFDVLRKLKALAGVRDVPVIMMSAACAPDDVRKAYALGADNFIGKPFTGGTLLSGLRAAIEGRARGSA